MTCRTEILTPKVAVSTINFKEPVLVSTVALFLLTFGFSPFQDTANLVSNAIFYARDKTIVFPHFARIFFRVQLPALCEGEGEVAVAVL